MRRVIKKRVLLIEENLDHLEKIKKLFLRDTYYQIVSVASNIRDAYFIYDEYTPDVVFLNNKNATYDIDEFKSLMQKTSPNCVIKNTYDVLEMKFNRTIIDFDSFYEIVTIDLKYNPDINNYSNYMVLDPKSNLADIDISIKNSGKLYNEVLLRISNLLLDIGIPINTIGYKFLREAILLGLDSPIGIVSITKNIYPNIAKKYYTSADAVERGIRASLKKAWESGGFDNLIDAFNIGFNDLFDKRPTNSEFLCLVVDRLRLEVSKLVN